MSLFSGRRCRTQSYTRSSSDQLSRRCIGADAASAAGSAAPAKTPRPAGPSSSIRAMAATRCRTTWKSSACGKWPGCSGVHRTTCGACIRPALAFAIWCHEPDLPDPASVIDPPSVRDGRCNPGKRSFIRLKSFRLVGDDTLRHYSGDRIPPLWILSEDPKTAITLSRSGPLARIRHRSAGRAEHRTQHPRDRKSIGHQLGKSTYYQAAFLVSDSSAFQNARIRSLALLSSFRLDMSCSGRN